MRYLSGKTVLVTGGTGTVGRELLRQLLDEPLEEIRIFDNNESETFLVEQWMLSSMLDRSKTKPATIRGTIGDVRDPSSLNRIMEGVDIVFHAAALKHVVVCEKAPFDAVQTNIIGVNNVIEAALTHDVERVIFTSSDKAVNPTNVMGTSKLMGERLMAAGNSLPLHKTILCSTRFGNVIGSRGSVVPLFYRQIIRGGPVTLTDPDMTRFVMTTEESARLILMAGEIAHGGEVFVTKMPVMRIEDLAHVMIRMLAPRFGRTHEDIPIEVIGKKPGEKMFEELLSEDEKSRAIELENLFVVYPTFMTAEERQVRKYPELVSDKVEEAYISTAEDALSREEIEQYLRDHRVLESLQQVT